jgi:hypothetical protein
MSGRAWMVAGGLFLVFNLNLRAIGSRDTHVTQLVALSLAAQGDANLDEYAVLADAGVERGYLTRTPSGHVMSNHPIVAALAAAPAYWLAIRSGWIDPVAPRPARVEAVGKVVASGLTAVACALLFLVCSKSVAGLGASAARVAFWSTIGVALGTPLWSAASQALWTHGPAAAAIALAFWLARENPSRTRGHGRESSSLRATFVGGAYALGVACRPLLVFFLLGAIVDQLRRRDPGVVWMAIGALVILGCLAGYNLLTFGTLAGGVAVLESAAVHQQTHLVGSAWSDWPLAGLAGILISPSRGLIVYSPLLLIAALGAWRVRRDPGLSWRVTLPVTAYVAGWSCYAVWWTGHSYGPRYASDIAIPLGLLVVHGWTWDASRAWVAARTLLVVWSISVQAIGVVCYPAGAWNAVPSDVDRAHERLWDWRDPQIIRTVRGGIYRGAGADR